MSDPCHCLAPSDACLLPAGSCLLTAALVSAEPAGAPQETAPGMMVSQELGAWSKCSFLNAAALEGCAKHAEAPGLQCESCSAGCQAQTPSLSAVSLSSQTSQSTCRCGLLTPTASEAGYSDLDRMMQSLCALASAAGGQMADTISLGCSIADLVVSLPLAIVAASCRARCMSFELGPALSSERLVAHTIGLSQYAPAVPFSSLPLAIISVSCRAECMAAESRPALSLEGVTWHIPLA